MARLDQTSNSIAIDDTVLFVNTNTNRVGINQGNPSVALQVTGSTIIDSGNLTLSTGGITASSGTVTAGTLTDGTLSITGGTITSSTLASPTITGVIKLNGTDITATATEINQLDGVTLGTAASADTGDFATAAQGLLADTALQIVAVDGVTITGDGTPGNPLVAAGGGGGGISIGDAVGGGTSGSILFVDASTNLAQDNGELYWDNANNRLGIGTTTPSAAIEVDAGASTEYAILTTGANGRVGLTTQYGGIHFNNVEGTPELWQLSERDTAQFDIAFGTPDAGNNVTSSNTLLRITNGGNVGIGLGATDPSTKLHVSGTIRQTNSTNAVLVSDGNGDIGSASNLQDVAYLESVGAFVPPAPPPTPTGALPDSPLPFPVNPVGWVEVNIGGTPYYLPAYQ